jgi:hypothetical protein
LTQKFAGAKLLIFYELTLETIENYKKKQQKRLYSQKFTSKGATNALTFGVIACDKRRAKYDR